MAAVLSTPRNLHSAPSGPEGAQSELAQQFRDAIALRSPEHHAEFPRCSDLEARCLQAAADKLHGVATFLRGIGSAQLFRLKLSGERHLHLSDLCRMATEPGREGKDAVLAILTQIAAAIGYRLEVMPGSAHDAHHAVACLSKSHGDLMAETVSALSDGRLDSHEVAPIRARVETLKKDVAQVEAVLTKAEL